MKKTLKQTLCWTMAAMTAMLLPVCAFAATDDIVDEAEIYLDEFVMVEQYDAAAATDNRLEGSSSYNSLANAPAIAVDVDPTAGEPEDEDPADINDYEPSPQTGAPSMMLPIGIGLIAAGCLPMLMRRIRNK